MRGLARIHLPARQRGAFLIVLLALVSVVIIYTVVAGLNRSVGDLARARDQKIYAALAQAKEALIAYAVTYADDPSRSTNLVPGFLPCPDLGPPAIPAIEGSATGSCGGRLVSVIGRLPWRTLGLDTLTGGSGECLWYAVSGTYKNNPNGVTTSNATSNMMNWDTNGQFNVMDTNGTSFLAGSSPTSPTDTSAVAVIFAPGSVVSGQNRTPAAGTAACGGNYIAANYLDHVTVGLNNFDNSMSAPQAPSALYTFLAGYNRSTFNDKLVYITRTDIWNAIKKRSDFQNNLHALTRRAAECVAMYGRNNWSGTGPSLDLTDKRLPWASLMALTNYAVDIRYDDANNNLQGRLSFRVNNAKSTTKNNLTGTSLFATASYCSYTAQELDWYEHWKDHLFYALAPSHKPAAANRPTSSPCTTCLSVNGGGSYAAVMIFAGENLDGKSRTLAEKGLPSPSSYLEGRNLTNDPNSGNINYEARDAPTPPTPVTFNDIIYAIDTSLLTVYCYSASTHAMAPVLSVPSSPPGPYAACP